MMRKSPAKVRTDPKSYRPICLLLPVLGKVLERKMVSCMECRLNGRMSDAQHGFRRGQSTECAWSSVNEYVVKSKCKCVLGMLLISKERLISWNG